MKFAGTTLVALKNINWMLLEKIVAMPISLLVSIVLARYLGTSVFGEYSYLTAIVSLVVPIATLGLNALLVKELLSDGARSERVMGTALLGRLFGCFICGALMLAYGSVWDNNHFSLILILACCQIFGAFTVFNFWFQANQQNKYVVQARLLALLIGTLIKAVIVYCDLGLDYLILGFGLDFLLVALCIFCQYRKAGGGIRLQPEMPYLHKLLSQSGWLIMSGIAAALNLKVDLIMLANLANNTEVGLYSVAARISEVWYFIPVTVTTAFFPILLKSKQKDPDEYQHKLQKLNDGLFALSMLVIIPVLLLSEFVIGFLFGASYKPAALMLNIHILGGVFIFMRALLSKWFITEGLLKFSLVTHGVGALINIIINWLLIPSMGGEGAAIASLISYAAASYFALFLSSKTRPMAVVMTKSMFLPLRYVLRK